jgi:hypothetical protein
MAFLKSSRWEQFQDSLVGRVLAHRVPNILRMVTIPGFPCIGQVWANSVPKVLRIVTILSVANLFQFTQYLQFYTTHNCQITGGKFREN